LITISYKQMDRGLDRGPVDEVTMVLGDEDANRDALMRSFQQFLQGIGYVFSVEELGEYD